MIWRRHAFSLSDSGYRAGRVVRGYLGTWLSGRVESQMTAQDAIELGGLLLAVYAGGFCCGFIVNYFRRFLEQI